MIKSPNNIVKRGPKMAENTEYAYNNPFFKGFRAATKDSNKLVHAIIDNPIIINAAKAAVRKGAEIAGKGTVYGSILSTPVLAAMAGINPLVTLPWAAPAAYHLTREVGEGARKVVSPVYNGFMHPIDTAKKVRESLKGPSGGLYDKVKHDVGWPIEGAYTLGKDVYGKGKDVYGIAQKGVKAANDGIGYVRNRLNSRQQQGGLETAVEEAA